MIDFGHLIYSAGEIMDYNRVTEKFDIPPITLLLMSSIFLPITLLLLNLLNYAQQYLLAGKKKKITNFFTTMTVYLLFDRLFTNHIFYKNGFIFVCVSLILQSQLKNKKFGVRISSQSITN